MRYEVDLINDVVLLLDRNHRVIDAFPVIGKTVHECPYPGILFYTFKSLLSLPGSCGVCHATVEEINNPCVSSGGFHAFLGVETNPNIPPQHQAANRSASWIDITFDEMTFYSEPDNVFPIEQISESFNV